MDRIVIFFRDSKILFLGFAMLFCLSSCVILPLPITNSYTLQKLETSSAVASSGTIFYGVTSNAVQPDGSLCVSVVSKSDLFSYDGKDVFNSKLRKQLWNTSFSVGGVFYNLPINALIYDNYPNQKYFAEPFIVEENLFEFQRQLSNDAANQFAELVRIHNKDGKRYSVFLNNSETARDGAKSAILSGKQEFLILFEDTVLASFSKDSYKIYSSDETDFLRLYIAVLSAFFEGVRQNERF